MARVLAHIVPAHDQVIIVEVVRSLPQLRALVVADSCRQVCSECDIAFEHRSINTADECVALNVRATTALKVGILCCVRDLVLAVRVFIDSDAILAIAGRLVRRERQPESASPTRRTS